MNWYFQFTPGDMWDYDEVGTHILIDGVVAGQPRKLITHSARNGFLYTMDRFNGQTVLAKPKTGKPLDYDPSKDIQTFLVLSNFHHVNNLNPLFLSASISRMRASAAASFCLSAAISAAATTARSAMIACVSRGRANRALPPSGLVKISGENAGGSRNACAARDCVSSIPEPSAVWLTNG
jgi:hypothetical protein